MLRVLTSSSPLVRDAFVRVLSLEKRETTAISTIYRRENWIFAFLHTPFTIDAGLYIASTFLPERLYFPYFGYSVDLMHEVGDVIVPNVFLSCRADIASLDIDESNRDAIAENPKFLSNFDEQKDYYVEDFGLSVGGIVVDHAPIESSEEIATRLMLAYEADAYVTESFMSEADALIAEDTPGLLFVGITSGKQHQKYGESAKVDDLAARNIVHTIRLMEEE